MNDQSSSQPVAVLTTLKSSTIPKRLDELTQQRIEGQRVSNELFALQRAIGKQAYTALERIVRTPPGNLDTIFQELSASDEDKAFFREWNAKYVALQDSFAVARSIINGSKNAWRDLNVDVEVGDNGRPFVHWEISDPEGPVFEMRSSLLSVLNLSSNLIRTIVEGTDRMVEVLDERNLKGLQESLESLQTAISESLNHLKERQAKP